MTLSSYPFLALSRELNVPYGEILALADAYRKLGNDDYDFWERDAIARHVGHPEVYHGVIDTVDDCRRRWPGIMT